MRPGVSVGLVAGGAVFLVPGVISTLSARTAFWWFFPLSVAGCSLAILAAHVFSSRLLGRGISARVETPAFVAVGAMPPLTFLASQLPSVPPAPEWVAPAVLASTFVSAWLFISRGPQPGSEHLLRNVARADPELRSD